MATFPRPLKPGGTVGVFAPASPAHARSDVLRGILAWERAGYRVKLDSQLYARDGYLAGSDRDRAQALMAMFCDPQVDAIQVLHGGFGSTQIIPHLDFDLLRDHPKPFVGRSDITALHLALAKFTGLITFYGPGLADTAAPRGSVFTTSAVQRALTALEPLGRLPQHPDDPFVRAIAPGRVTAPVFGGCLWPLCKTIGTPWQPDLRGSILFFEEAGEPPWSIDAHLTHLDQAGMLDGVVGIVIGRLKDCDWSAERPEYPCNLSLDDVLDRHFASLGVPVLHGIPVGHEAHTLTIPLGVRATLDVTEEGGSLMFDESSMQG